MSNARVWLFRGLVTVAAGLMLLSWFMPWWRADIMLIAGWVQIRPWGLELDWFTNEFIRGAHMPAYFAPLMWIYLGLATALLLFSLFVKERNISLGRLRLSLPQVIIGGVGLSYIVVFVLAVIVAAIRTGDFFGLHLLGRTLVVVTQELGESYVEAGLLLGYWLACAVGPLLVVLALVRNKIIGKPKLIT